MPTKTKLITQAFNILNLLKLTYPKAKISLNYNNNWELLVAVILSAQCTDLMVNKVTSRLFKKYKTLEDYIRANPQEFEKDIKSTGFYKNKTKNILAAAKLIKNKCQGQLPKSMIRILTIPGVARKTANIVLGNAYGIVEGIAVDTHVRRLSQRLGLTKNEDPNKIEQNLMKLFAKSDWFKLSYLLISHGRAICQARKPRCAICVLNKICPSAFKFP